MPLVDTPYGSVFYAESNRASSPVILIHGAGSSHLGWSKELRRLEDRRVLTIDLPGHGRSTSQGYAQIKPYAGAVLSLLDALQIEQAILIGHSMGGAISQMLAVEHPARVAGLVLIGTGAYLGVNPDLLRNIEENYDLATELINKWSWSKDTPEDLRRLGLAELRKVPQNVLYGDYAACSQFDLREQITQINAPALVIGGTADKMTPLALNQFLVDNIRQSTWVQIEGGGHWMMLEQPQAVGAAITAWLRGVA